MTIRKALRKLYTAMCGGTTTSDTAGDLINDIATDYTGGGGSDLPEPGASGNVLTSNGTAWASAAPRNDADIYIEATLDLSTMTYGEPSVSFADALAAVNAGKTVMLRLTISSAIFDAPLMLNGQNYLVFAGAILIGGNPNQYVYGVTGFSAETGLTLTDAIPVQPAIGQNDEGKVLYAHNGAYELVTPNDPLALTGEVNGGNFTITSHTAAQINDAITAHRPVYIDVGTPFNARCYLQTYSYTDSEHYSFDFVTMVVDVSQSKITATYAKFDNSLTCAVGSLSASAT